MLRSIFISLIRYMFFNRYNALIFCISFMFFSLWVELCLQVENFFSSSGTLFTVAGLFLNIKMTAIFHLTQKIDGKNQPLNTTSKYILATRSGGVFATSDSDEEKHRKVREIEKDEIFGVCYMIFGTALWGYGSYFIKWISCVCS